MVEEMSNAISAHFLFASSPHPTELSGLAVRSDEQGFVQMPFSCSWLGHKSGCK